MGLLDAPVAVDRRHRVERSGARSCDNLGYTAFPSVPGGKGNLNDLAGNTENYYSVLKNTRYPQAVAAFLTVMYSPTFVKKELALGNLTTTTSTPGLISGATAPYLKYQYGLIKKAPAFQLSWDQAWPQTDSNTIHTAVANYFDNLNAVAFSQAMAGLKPAQVRVRKSNAWPSLAARSGQDHEELGRLDRSAARAFSGRSLPSRSSRVCAIVPLGVVVWLSFTSWDALGSPHWVGTGNWTTAVP